VRAVRAVRVATMSMGCEMIGNIFMHWSNMLAGLMSRTISG
jgi:hypothetical protein